MPLATLCTLIMAGNPRIDLRCETGEMLGILETVQTGVHCAAIPNDPVLFLDALLILSLTLFPSAHFVYLLVFSFSLNNFICCFDSLPSQVAF